MSNDATQRNKTNNIFHNPKETELLNTEIAAVVFNIAQKFNSPAAEQILKSHSKLAMEVATHLAKDEKTPRKVEEFYSDQHSKKDPGLLFTNAPNVRVESTKTHGM
ncbi:hypothetical protein L3V79_01325 [Thiotrichales bacterium 19S9-12]|nr:hypothetical protein [Thiotrichales bacterium 19S9-11]MCF6810999.1 hypothetical protein [Thiotrichales bacterium 19S9-12]